MSWLESVTIQLIFVSSRLELHGEQSVPPQRSNFQ